MDEAVCCPYCGHNYVHSISTMDVENYPDEFKQKCLFAMAAHCETNPKHLFTILIGQHKGQILLSTLKAE